MYILTDDLEEMSLTDEQRDYLWDMGYIFVSDDGVYQPVEDATMEDIENVLMKAGLTAPITL